MGIFRQLSGDQLLSISKLQTQTARLYTRPLLDTSAALQHNHSLTQHRHNYQLKANQRITPMLEPYWNELYRILSAGNPPLAMQLLVLNTFFFMLFIVRRMRGSSAMRREVAITVQALLLAANGCLLFQDTIFSAVRTLL
jgi:hypothetical protein